jgi:hypothetical protein
MMGVNPVTTYNPNPALLQQQQQTIAMTQQPMVAQPATAGMNDVQQALAGANALGVEGTTQIVPQILAVTQQTAQIKEANKANNDLKQKNMVLEAQIQALALKGQQQGVQGQALQQLQTTMPTTMPQQTQQSVVQVPVTVAQPTTTATPNYDTQKSAAITSGNLGELAKVMTSEVTKDAPSVQKAMDNAIQVQTYRNTLMAQGIPKDQATALANQKIQADNTAAAGQVIAPQQQVMVQQPQQIVVQPPQQAQAQQPLVVQQPMMQQAPVAVQPQPAPSQEEMVYIAGVGPVSKPVLTALLQNTSKEAQEAQAKAQQEAQEKAQQQQTTPSATVAPRSVLPTDYTLQQALPQTALMPQQALTGFPPVASPLAFASVNSYGNSGITAEKYQQLLAYMNQQQQPAVASTSTNTPSTSATSSAEADSFAKAKLEAAKLGFDTTNMPNSYAELRAKQKKRRRKLTTKNLATPKLYLPKPENKYDFYGSGEAST